MRAAKVFALIAGMAGAMGAVAQTDPHAHHRAAEAMAADEHAHHRAEAASVRVVRASYRLPDVELRDEEGRSVRLRELLTADQPLAVNFIYTSCTSICPVMTATFLQMQKELATAPKQPHFISISVDPDFDSAAILKAYAQRYGARWTFLTGSGADVNGVLRAFDAYRGNKVNHVALTLLRAANSEEWTRVEGLASAEQLVALWKDVAT
jgi:protein SCO1/2